MEIKIPTIEELLTAGVHFGHQSRRWNPLMKKYIYASEKKSHIIDAYKTQEALKVACDFLTKIAAQNKRALIVGTKRQARAIVVQVSKETDSLYVIERWLGGTFTNFNNVSKNIKELDNLIESKKAGKFDKYTKKEKLLIDRKIEKLEKFYGGLRNLTKDVGVMIVIDIRKENIAVKEAKEMNIPVVALVDTNSDPSKADVVIPSNDDAIKAIELILNTLKEAILKGKRDAENQKNEVVIEPTVKVEKAIPVAPVEKPKAKINKDSKPKTSKTSKK